MRLGLREIRRAKVRFLLLAGAVGLLVFLLLFFQATAGALVTALTGGLASADADVVVYADTARANPSVSVLTDDIVDEVSTTPGVEAVDGVGLTFGAATRADGDADVVVVGAPQGGGGVPDRADEGRLTEQAGEALLGTSGFAEVWPIGEVVTVEEVELEVVGIVEDAAYNATPTLYVPLSTYEEVVRARIGPQAPLPLSFAAVTAGRGVTAEEVAADIAGRVGGVEAFPLAEAVEALPGIGTIDRSFGILYMLLYVVVAIVTGVFFLILTVQKRDALVLLRAVGAERRDVVALVLAQVVFVVGAGVLVGATLAVALLRATQDTFGASIDAGTVLTSSAVVVLLGLLATVGAVRRVTAIEPIEATRASGIG